MLLNSVPPPPSDVADPISEIRRLHERIASLEAENTHLRLTHAEECRRRKEDFLAVVGHELRNPLAPIVTAVHMIKLRHAVKCDKEIAILDRQVTHLMRIIDDLLDVSRTP